MILPDGWSTATREGISVAFKRYTGRDRLQVLAWQQEHVEAVAAGSPLVEIAQRELQSECEAMAARIIDWPRGDTWTAQKLLELNGTDPAAWSWLSQLLYGPAWRDLESGGSESKKNYSRLLRCHQGIHRLLRVLVNAV